MTDQISRFERLRRKLPPETKTLVDSVEAQVLPLFANSGYVRLPQYGGPRRLDADLARSIVMQRQTGKEWPTVDFHFADLGRPFLTVEFAWLPEPCVRWEHQHSREIPRAEAVINEGYVFFRLMRAWYRNEDSTFGMRAIWPIFGRRARLRRELDTLQRLSAWLIETLSRDMPAEWVSPGTSDRVHPHACRRWGAIALRRDATALD